MFRVVIDPGVLIAALISSKGAPRRLLEAWIDGAFELVVSPALLSELEQVLHREKFRPYVSIADVRSYVALLKRFATLASDAEALLHFSPDPGDDYLIALATAEVVDYVVSGDAHLTNLKGAPIEILTPREFLNRLQLAQS